MEILQYSAPMPHRPTMDQLVDKVKGFVSENMG
jgi:hypothetical protein